MESILPTTNATQIKASRYARIEYKGEPKMVLKARPVSDELAEKIISAGYTVAEKGTPCPYAKIYKVSASKVLFGTGIKYKRMVNKAALRAADMVVDYTPTHREMGYFPIFEELFYVKNDFSRMYMRAYGIPGDTSKPEVHYYAETSKGVEIELKSVYEIVQWLPAADFNKFNGTEKPVALKDDDGNFVVKQDENGNPICDENGNPILVPYPMIKLYKMFDPSDRANPRPLKVIINGENLINSVLNWDKKFDLSDLENIKQAYEKLVASEE